MKLMGWFVMILFFACDSGSEIFESQGVMSVDYGVGAPCGGCVMNYNGMMYRTYNGGAAPIDNNNFQSLYHQYPDYHEYS